MGRAEVGEGGRLESRGTGCPCVYEGDDERLAHRGAAGVKKDEGQGTPFDQQQASPGTRAGRGEVRTAETTTR